MLVAASLMGCMEFLEMSSTDGLRESATPTAAKAPNDGQPRSGTTSATVRVAGPLTIASAKGSHADIATLTVKVTGEDAEGTHQDPLATAELTRSPDGVWAGTLSGLTIDTPLTFTAEALDSDNVVIFSGTHTATLSSVGAQITIRLNAIDDAVDNRFPRVIGISISNVSTGVPAAVTITVTGSASEQLHYELTGGTFDPSSGEITLSAGAGTLTSSYEPPDVPGWYTVQIALRNAQGNRVEVDFQIRVQTAGLTAKLGPVVRGITGKRTPAGVRWTAAVSADDGSGLTYAWTFTEGEKSGTFSNATENPTILTSYTQTTTGTVSVTVTDAVGLTASASLEVTAEMFPDLPLMSAAATLIVNEVDYAQSGSDAVEFIEILNPGSVAVDLSDYRIELVNGGSGTTSLKPYETYTSSEQLVGSAFLVIAVQDVIDHLPSGTDSLLLSTDGIQSGPDGVRIVAVEDDRVVDAVAYEGVVPGAGEGSPAPEDDNSVDTSIGRCPNGFDSDDNGLDFRTMTSTPGAANTCS